jgi:hypothetical protein
MTDMRNARDIARRLEQTQVKEVPGGITGFTSFYASGTFTPTYTGSTIAGTFTYIGGGQVGLYTRIGNQVFIHLFLQISAISVAPTGSMQISGLPFTAAASGLSYSLSVGFLSNVNTSANIVQLTAIALGGAPRIGLFEAFDNIATVAYPAANFTNVGAAMLISGSYSV